MNKTAIIIVSVIAAIAVVAAGVLFAQNQSTQKALNEAEKDLIYYKNTDLGKEVEILNLKLTNAKSDLTAERKAAAAAQARVKTLEANLAKLPAYLAAIDAIETMVANGPSQEGLANADAKVAALKDSRVSDKWQQAKKDIDVERRSWSGEPISDTVKAITSRIRDLIE